MVPCHCSLTPNKVSLSLSIDSHSARRELLGRHFRAAASKGALLSVRAVYCSFPKANGANTLVLAPADLG